jgi:hypothetical protein
LVGYVIQIHWVVRSVLCAEDIGHLTIMMVRLRPTIGRLLLQVLTREINVLLRLWPGLPLLLILIVSRILAAICRDGWPWRRPGRIGMYPRWNCERASR